MTEETMFDPDLMNNFRSEDEDDITDEVKQAWFKFCYFFLPRVSKLWAEALKISSKNNRLQLSQNSSVSDEALTKWIIYCKYKDVKEDFEAGFPDKKKENKGRKSGPHDSIAHIKEYVEYTNKIKLARENVESNKKWNALFWEQYNEELEKDPEFVSNNKVASNTSATEVPLPEMDDPGAL